MDSVTFSSDMQVDLVHSCTYDMSVVNAARVSTQGEAVKEAASRQESEKDIGLIKYLMRDRHGTPFEHNFMTFFISAPLFVFREFQRHRIASYNEESGRYTTLKPVFYLPDEERCLVQVGKPGKYEFLKGTQEQHALVVDTMKKNSIDSYKRYVEMLNAGIAKELARAVLPLNIYSSMYVSLNARSLMNFLSLRTKKSNAKFPSFPQREIEMCAEKMEDIWRKLMPHTAEIFDANGRVAP